jgi:hypothetical protein
MVRHFLSPKYKNNDWLVMDSQFSPEDCPGHLVLIHHPDIEDGYSQNLTIQKMEIFSNRRKDGFLKK